MSDGGSERSDESSDSVAWYERGNIETVFSGQEKQACNHVEICPNVDLVAMADERNVRLLVCQPGVGQDISVISFAAC